MSEHKPDFTPLPRSPEQEAVFRLGDVITTKSHGPDMEFLIVRGTDLTSKSVEALKLPTLSSPDYGMAGTVAADDIVAVLRHLSFNEATEAVARAYSPGAEPDEELLEHVRTLMADRRSDDDTE